MLGSWDNFTALDLAVTKAPWMMDLILRNPKVQLPKNGVEHLALLFSEKKWMAATMFLGLAGKRIDLNVKDGRDKTLLMYAAQNCDVEQTRFLLNAGAGSSGKRR